jgi:HK97 family phage prohead protease
METKKINKRMVTLLASVHLREAEDGSESRVLEGYALKFGVRSVLMGYYYPQYEILEPGCITEEMLREQRIYFTMFHNRQIVLGRWDKGEGTLKLTVDSIGLKVECEMPHTPDGDTALELVRRGDLSEMSFIYSTDEDDSENCVSYEKTEETTEWGATIYLRHVKKILGIYDVTIAGNPAYEDTEIQAREQVVKDYVKREEEATEEPKPEKQADEAETEENERERKDRLREARKLRDIASALT